MLTRADWTALILLAIAVLVPGRASAQTDSGGFASVAVSALSIDDDSTTSIAATIGYRLNPILSLGVEFTSVPTFRPAVPNFPIPARLRTPTPIPLNVVPPGGAAVDIAIFPSPSITIEGEDGHATIFTGNLRLSIPTRWPRLRPYLVAGGGVGNVTDEVRFSISYNPTVPFAGFPGTFPMTPSFSEVFRRSTTDFAMTFGGGVSVIMTERWSIDADARYLGITGHRDINTGRYGGGVTFRF
jgi:hypothetical protein